MAMLASRLSGKNTKDHTVGAKGRSHISVLTPLDVKQPGKWWCYYITTKPDRSPAQFSEF